MAAAKTPKPLSTNVKKSATQPLDLTGQVKSDDFLRDYVKDAREDMAWRREFESRLVQLLMIFYPILGTAMVTLYQTDMKSEVYRILAAGTITFLLFALVFVTYRICREHKAYAAIGLIVANVWKYFKLFEDGAYLPDKPLLPASLLDLKKGLGQGYGYRWTLVLMWLIGIAVIAMIIGLAVFKTP